ncbi:MAG TPA: DUF5050 domain-containing protein [Clostridia bacterium]|nr:DUF5050 domain-containing protein [Clostridia bacterium]
MKQSFKLILIVIVVISMLLTACQDQGEKSPSSEPSESNAVTPSPAASTAPGNTPVTSQSPEPTPVPEDGVQKVILTNGSDSRGNTAFSASHYNLHITYTGEYVELVNYMSLMRHGNDIEKAPVAVDGFEYQGEDVQFYNGKLYFLLYDYNTGVYYLYSYDYENPPSKVTESTVYHYEFVGGTIYYTKEFVQGPIYSMNLDGSGEKQLTQMRAHSFCIDGGSIYFYATDAGTAPGLVRYNIASGEETTVIFPFFSHNYLVFEGYAYYVNEGTYRSIHRVNLSNQAVEDLWLEIGDYTVSLNISDGMLYILTGSGIFKSNLDGSGRTQIYEAYDYLQTGLYIFGDRIYVTDGYDIIVVDRNDGTSFAFPMN